MAVLAVAAGAAGAVPPALAEMLPRAAVDTTADAAGESAAETAGLADLASVAATEAPARRLLTQRVAAVRAAWADGLNTDAAPDGAVQQASNWTNWPKWSKWSNWANK